MDGNVQATYDLAVDWAIITILARPQRTVCLALGLGEILRRSHSRRLAVTRECRWLVFPSPERCVMDCRAVVGLGKRLAHFKPNNATSDYGGSLDSDFRNLGRLRWSSAFDTGHRSGLNRHRVVLVCDDIAVK